MKSICLQLILLMLLFFNSFGQLPEADFSLSAEACILESLKTTNQSQNSSRFEWDLCQGDLQLTPLGKSVVNVQGNVTAGSDFVFDGNNWYGFVTSRETNSIKRLDFGHDLNSTPTITDLGNIGNLNPWRPIDIQIVHDNGEWFGFVYGESTNLITRIDFGSSLTNATVLMAEVVATGDGSSNCGLSILRNGTNYVLAYSNAYSLGTLLLSDIRAVPTASDKMQTMNIPGILNFGDIKLIEHLANFYAYIPSYGSQKLYRASFGTDPLSVPIVTDISNGLIGSNSPFGIDIGFDGGQFVAILCTIDGVLIRINIGVDPNQLPQSGARIGNLSLLGNTLKISMRKHLSSWKAFTTSWNSGEFYMIEFPNQSCNEYPVVLTDDSPRFQFHTDGEKYISLRAFSGNEFSESHQTLRVNTITAPGIQLFIAGICTDLASLFDFSSDLATTSTNWSFGDTQTSTLPNPTHQYTLAGDYLVSLEVTADNGCNNYIEKPIKIYDPPDAQFTSPPGLICTNNEFTFINNTLDNFDGNLTYEWLVNDVLESTTRDFNYAFTAGGDQQVKLKTSIPGCSDELTQTLLNVQIGPVVDFSFTGKCEEEEILFTNASSGSISGYQWDFDNGNTSTEVNPVETFSTYGNYQVSLITTGTNGCNSTITKPVTIYSVPQTNFSIELPPFSCAGSASQFNDLTPPMPDSNITSWAWSFGDPSNGSSSQKNPLYTYSLAGDYSVTLSTDTNFGCSNSIQKTVTIYPSPHADFSFGPACVDKETQFTDLSTGDIKSWLWSIQSNSYTVQNPKHTFKSAASYSALLTVTGNNGCISQATKNVSVPVAVLPYFTSSSTCEDKPSVFDEITKGGVDPAASWSWNFANQGSGTGSPAEHVFSSTGNYSVTMSTTRQSGCTYSVTKTIPIVESPKAQFNLFLTSGAAPFTTELTNQSTKATKYLWKPGDPRQANSTAFVPTFTYTELGDYTIELEASNELGCKDYMQQLIQVVIPQINAAVTDFRLELVPGSDHYSPVVTIENKSNLALINPVVNLDLSGNATVSQTIEAIIKPDEGLAYRFTANISPQSLEFACAEVEVSADDYALDNRQCVNLEDEYVSRIPYPNPASDELMLEWINSHDESMEVVIYNAAGQTVISRKYEPTLKGLNQVKLDVSALSAGIYFVSYSIDGQAQNFRFSIVR